MHRSLFIAGCISGFLSVAVGAFAAHLLKSRITPDLFEIFEVGVRYQFYHAFAILIAAIVWQWLGGASETAGWLFVGGTVVFSGSLYLMSLTGMRWLGAITPIGGVMFLAGWAMLAIAAWRR